MRACKLNQGSGTGVLVTEGRLQPPLRCACGAQVSRACCELASARAVANDDLVWLSRERD
jgi:hypothetical protein